MLSFNKSSKKIKMFSGLVRGKVDRLNCEVKATLANILTIQETHSIRKGIIYMLVDFVVLEAIRPAKHEGAMCAIMKILIQDLLRRTAIHLS